MCSEDANLIFVGEDFFNLAGHIIVVDLFHAFRKQAWKPACKAALAR